MFVPSFPVSQGATAIGVSLLTIVWWVGVWGFADTIIHLVFKGSTFMELGLYIFMIATVLLIVFLKPDLLKQL
jgi:hypothetical protein